MNDKRFRKLAGWLERRRPNQFLQAETVDHS